MKEGKCKWWQNYSLYSQSKIKLVKMIIFRDLPLLKLALSGNLLNFPSVACLAKALNTAEYTIIL